MIMTCAWLNPSQQSHEEQPTAYLLYMGLREHNRLYDEPKYQGILRQC